MKITFIGILVVVLSLLSFKPKAKFHVEGQILIHRPYCGGAEPTKEIENGYDEPYANATFYVKSKINNSRRKGTVAKVITDAEGNFHFEVKKPGTYYFVEASKTLSLSRFIDQHNKPTQFLTYVGDKQAAEMYKKADAQLEIQSDKKAKVIIESKCFSGTNPLLKYTGPLPN